MLMISSFKKVTVWGYQTSRQSPLRHLPIRSRCPDLAAVTIVTRFLRNYPLPHSYQNNKTENIKVQVKPYSFDRRQFFFFGFHLVKGVRDCIAL